MRLYAARPGKYSDVRGSWSMAFVVLKIDMLLDPQGFV